MDRYLLAAAAFFLLSGCGGGVMFRLGPGGKTETTEEEVKLPFELNVDVYVWEKNSDFEESCDPVPCLDYEYSDTLHYGEQLFVRQSQSWPVYLIWSSDTPVTIPALGVTRPVRGGEIPFNPWQDMDIAFCNGTDCTSVLSLNAIEPEIRSDCAYQAIEGFYEESPVWMKSQGECYGVKSVSTPYCAHYSCTTGAPYVACPKDNEPHPDCAEFGCQCNLSAWSNVGVNHMLYDVALTVESGVSVPLFADRWEAGGVHAESGNGVVFRMYGEYRLSHENMTIRPVMDMRTNWSGSFDTIPHPDGWEGPPFFMNEYNSFISPPDGFWPIQWEVRPAGNTDVWMQPVWNVIVLPGAESGTAEFRNLSFSACGPGVAPVTVDTYGHSY